MDIKIISIYPPLKCSANNCQNPANMALVRHEEQLYLDPVCPVHGFTERDEQGSAARFILFRCPGRTIAALERYDRNNLPEPFFKEHSVEDTEYSWRCTFTDRTIVYAVCMPKQSYIFKLYEDYRVQHIYSGWYAS